MGTFKTLVVGSLAGVSAVAAYKYMNDPEFRQTGRAKATLLPPVSHLRLPRPELRTAMGSRRLSVPT